MQFRRYSYGRASIGSGAWVFLAVLVNGLTEFLHIGRYGSILIFVASDCLLGYFAFPQMLSEAGIKAIATAVFVLFFLPGRLFVIQFLSCLGLEQEIGIEKGFHDL